MPPLDLDDVALVDHHAHAVLRAQPSSLDEFRGLFSESGDPRQWPHVATGVTYRRAIRELAELFGVEPAEEAVYAHRRATEPRDYARLLLAATSTELLLLDDGYPPPAVGLPWEEFAGWVEVPARRAQAVRDALELAPVSKLLYASDAARTPELYFLAARWWRRALAEVLPELLPEDEAGAAARLILRDNARLLYRL